MKKLMIAAAIVYAAALSQAATVKWKTATIATPDDTSKNITKSRVNVYYYKLDAASGDLMALCLTEAGAGATKTWTVNSGYSSSSINGTLDGVAFTSGALTVTDKTAYKIEDGTAYGAILITRDVNDNGSLDVGDWYMIAQASQAIEADTEYTPSMADLKTSNWVQLTSSDVPEPTSGLLLLLGVAGLALKRKRD